jgi:hypothetical protein
VTRTVRLLLAVACGVAILAVPAGAPAATCAVPRHAKSALNEGSAVVYSVRRKRRAGGGRQFFACSRLTARKTSLGTVRDPCSGLAALTPFVTAGPYLAYAGSGEECQEAGETFFAYLFLLDLRTGAKTRASTFVAGFVPAGGLAVRADGAIAWIAQRVLGNERVYEVWVSDAAGPRMVDSAATPATALTLTDAAASWSRNGQPMSAPVGAGPAPTRIS